MTEELITPKALGLLKMAVNIQERMLDGALLIFEGFEKSTDTEVSLVSRMAIDTINQNREMLDAMIDGLNVTHH
jgi:hypothetical protein